MITKKDIERIRDFYLGFLSPNLPPRIQNDLRSLNTDELLANLNKDHEKDLHRASRGEVSGSDDDVHKRPHVDGGQ